MKRFRKLAQGTTPPQLPPQKPAATTVPTPRSVENPYGRLFTQDNDFATLVRHAQTKQEDCKK